jgi:hypothetical protein
MEPADLQEVMATARQIFAWYVALQEAGFNETQAYGLMQPLVLNGTAIKRD